MKYNTYDRNKLKSNDSLKKQIIIWMIVWQVANIKRLCTINHLIQPTATTNIYIYSKFSMKSCVLNVLKIVIVDFLRE